MVQTRWFARQAGVTLSLGAVIALVCLVAPRLAAQFPAGMDSVGTGITHSGGHKGVSAVPDDSLGTKNDGTPTLSARQKEYIVHANFEKSKSDAAELAALAKGLRAELNKPDITTDTLEVMNRIEKIEKLAKKIREETKGF